MVFIYSVPAMCYYRYGGAGRIYLLPVGVLLVYVRKFGRGGFVPSPRFSTLAPWSSKGVFININPMSKANKTCSIATAVVLIVVVAVVLAAYE